MGKPVGPEPADENRSRHEGRITPATARPVGNILGLAAIQPTGQPPRRLEIQNLD